MDASALVAMIVEEPGYRELVKQIIDDGRPIWSPVSRWETVRAISRLRNEPEEEADQRVSQVAAGGAFEMIAIGNREAEIALDAHRRFGKGKHPARLNMGDCFAYACAKANDATLLYKGDDFAQTDLA